MPRLNGSGPVWGGGPGAGYGLGNCGFSRGTGRGCGFRRWTSQDQKSALTEEVEILKEELILAQKDLKDLENQK